MRWDTRANQKLLLLRFARVWALAARSLPYSDKPAAAAFATFQRALRISAQFRSGHRRDDMSHYLGKMARVKCAAVPACLFHP